MQIEPYRERATRFLGLVNHGHWRIKLYGICAQGHVLPLDLERAAVHCTLQFLPEPAVTEDRHGVGFLTVHHGSAANWILLDWWESECILCHRLFRSSFEEPERVSEVREGHLMACAYEMVVQQFERDAWIETVMADGVDRGIGRYLECVPKW